MDTIKQFVQQVALDRGIEITEESLTMKMALEMYATGLRMHDGDEEKALEFAKGVITIHLDEEEVEEEEELWFICGVCDKKRTDYEVYDYDNDTKEYTCIDCGEEQQSKEN